MDRRHVRSLVYCLLLMPAIAYFLLQQAILRRHGAQSVLAKALGSDIKGKMSIAFYAAAIVAAFVSPLVSVAIFVRVCSGGVRAGTPRTSGTAPWSSTAGRTAPL